MALRMMNLAVDHVFACDNDPIVKKTLLHNYSPRIFFDDIFGRSARVVPAVDLYHAGFPCQPFSSAGRRLGTADPSLKGIIINEVLLYVQLRKPRVVLLENVKGLATMHPQVLENIDNVLVHAGYSVKHKVLQASANGVPQNRERLLVVGIHRRHGANSWSWPPDMRTPRLSRFLDRITPEERTCNLYRRLPPKSQSHARANVKSLLAMCKHDGIDLKRSQLIADIESTNLHVMSGVSPCLTKSRASSGGFWIVSRGRRMSITEMQRLMGVGIRPPRGGVPATIEKPVGISSRQWGSIIGNSIPISLLQRVLCRVLPAANLYSGGLRDLWGR